MWVPGEGRLEELFVGKQSWLVVSEADSGGRRAVASSSDCQSPVLTTWMAERNTSPANPTLLDLLHLDLVMCCVPFPLSMATWRNGSAFGFDRRRLSSPSLGLGAPKGCRFESCGGHLFTLHLPSIILCCKGPRTLVRTGALTLSKFTTS